MTFGWFSYGLLTTSLAVGKLRHNFYFHKLHPSAWFTLACIAMTGAYNFDYEKEFVKKTLAYTAFCGFMGMMILPIVSQSSLSLASDAALITGLSVMTFSGMAYMAPSESYLKLKGPLDLLTAVMMFTGAFSIAYPASYAAYNFWVAGGCILSSMLMMVHF